MENEVIKVEKEQNNHFSINLLMAIMSSLVSLLIAVYSINLSILKNYWFIAIAIYFVIEAILIIWPLIIKDEYQAMRFQGISQIISVLIFMSYLLFMVLWNDADKTMDYSFLTYLIFISAAAFKVLLYAFTRLLIKNEYNPLLHAYSNGALISALYLVLIIGLIITNRFYPGSSNAVFDNLLKEKPIWIYIVDILLNASLTVFAALLALSTDIRAVTKEQLTTTNKIKHTIKWFVDHEVSMFFGLIFTMYLAVLSLMNMKQSFFYILLFIYYIGTAVIRFFNYLWHKRIQKVCGDNQIMDNRKSSWILLFDSFAYLIFSNVLVVAAIFMMIQKANVGANIYLFLFMNIPLGIMRFVNANKSIRKNRRGNNTYRLGVSLIGLVSTFFTLLEIVAISMHAVPVIWIRYLFIILAIIATKIAVIVVAIIFVIHWLRSIILNRKSKERKLVKQNENI